MTMKRHIFGVRARFRFRERQWESGGRFVVPIRSRGAEKVFVAGVEAKNDGGSCLALNGRC